MKKYTVVLSSGQTFIIQGVELVINTAHGYITIYKAGAPHWEIAALVPNTALIFVDDEGREL